MLLEIFLFTMSHRSMNWSRSLCVLGTRAVGVEAVLVTGMCLPGMEGGNEFSVLCTGCAFAPEAALHISLIAAPRPSSLEIPFEVCSLSRGSDTLFLHLHRQEEEGGGILLPTPPVSRHGHENSFGAGGEPVRDAQLS